VEPPPSVWGFPPVDAADPDGLVGVGADLEPGTLLAAYRQGMFPMPVGRTGPVGWWSPDPRGVLPLDGLLVTRSLHRSCRRYEVRIDTAFETVIRACADPGRPHGWITDDIEMAYLRLHDLGWAHSVETWTHDGELVGGLYGVAIAGLFAGESMFHRQRDASKVALVHLVELLRADDEADRLLDVQWATPHLATLGVIELARNDYLGRLGRALELPLPAAFM
jgi:leucyl/phenylalanyl-tRNA---protein transferase